MNHTPTELIIALDFSRPDRAFHLIEALKGLPVLYKVGFELFLGGGPEIIRELVHRKYRVFLDLKFHDIPHTVARAVQQAAFLKVEMFSLHLSGGSAMIKAVVDELSTIPTLRPKILGVTVLTSFDDVHWAEVTRVLTGHAVKAGDSVSALVQHASSWGVDGIVCSATELNEIRKKFPLLYTVVPGIRPEGFFSQDQARVMTPAQARQAGAHAIVLGRPITEAQDPRVMVEQVLRELGLKENQEGD